MVVLKVVLFGSKSIAIQLYLSLAEIHFNYHNSLTSGVSSMYTQQYNKDSGRRHSKSGGTLGGHYLTTNRLMNI